MSCKRVPVRLLSVIIVLGIAAALRGQTPTPRSISQSFGYEAAPADNPLKGLVPYHGQGGAMPHSMEFWYFPMADLMKGPEEFDWRPLEEKLESARQRGNQMVVRVYLEYPGKKTGVPQHVIASGLRFEKYLHGKDRCETPDYSNPTLRQAIQAFVKAMGQRYDNDPRIGFITMGIVGQWGEWHTYPRNDLFPEKPIQAEVMDAFEKAFPHTHVQMRYPAGNEDWQKASNFQRPFGYHDDSFGWATLDTGRQHDDWFFVPLLRKAGQPAVDKWMSYPIGGEIRPELWGCVFDRQSCSPQHQALDQCIQKTHVTWLMDTSFPPYKPHPNQKQRIQRAVSHVQKMGYEFQVKRAELSVTDLNKVQLKCTIGNRGVAPFYYPWTMRVTIRDQDRIVHSFDTEWDLRSIPAQKEKTFSVSMKLDEKLLSRAGFPSHTLGIQVINPMQGGKPLRFANRRQMENGFLPLFDAKRMQPETPPKQAPRLSPRQESN